MALILLGGDNRLDFALGGRQVIAFQHSLSDFEPDFSREFVIGGAGQCLAVTAERRLLVGARNDVPQ
ncbi:hypothetical protein D3C84_696400 [compost metagenome]